MTLHVETKEDEKRQLTVTITVDEEQVKQALATMARRLAKEIRIPGFRPGKAPYRVVLSYFGEDTVREQVAEEMMDASVTEALEQHNIKPFRQVKLEKVELQPLQYILSVPLDPVVELGDYRSQRKELRPVAITEEAVQEALEHLRTHHMRVEPVTRPSEMGDTVVVTGKGYLSRDVEDVIFNEERYEVLLVENAVFAGVNFVEHLVGLTAGDETHFTLTFPDEYEAEAWRGQSAEFALTILDVLHSELPPLDDELARQEGSYESLEELRAAIATSLQGEAEAQYRNDLFTSMSKFLVEEVEELRYPPILIEEHLDDAIQKLKTQVTQRGWSSWAEYLEDSKKSEEGLRDSLEERAVFDLERGLTLSEFLRREGLSYTGAELEAAIEKKVARFEDSPQLQESLRKYYLSDAGSSAIVNDVLMEKVYDRIAEIYSGTAPALPEADGESDAEAGAQSEPVVKDSAEPETDSTAADIA